MLLFVDVTASLRDEEWARVMSLVRALPRNLLMGTELTVYALKGDSKLPGSISTHQVAGPLPASEEKQLSGALAQAHQTGRRPPIGEPRTCIFRALLFGGSRMREERHQQGKVDSKDIVLISDMLEDCQETPGVGRVDISKSAQLARLKASPEELGRAAAYDFSDTRVTIIVPSRQAPDLGRPAPEDLEQFWTKFFDSVKQRPTEVRWVSDRIPAFPSISR